MPVFARRRFASALALGTALTLCSGAAWAQSSAEKRLKGELEDILRAPELEEAFVGVHVRNLQTGKVLFDHNSTKLFNPASNMKLLTTAAALWYLGGNYRFRTVARRDRGALKNGKLTGNIYVKGYGDPTLTTENLFGLVNEIALSGLTQVQGNLIIDNSFFDNVAEGPGWEQEIGDHAYAAPMGALSVNFNTFMARILPGERVGDPAKVMLWPPIPMLEAQSSAHTRGHGSRTRLWIGTSEENGDKIRLTVRGSIAANMHYGKTIRRRIHQPAVYAGQMIKHLLEMRGIKIKGRVKIGRMGLRGTQPLAAHWSKPLAEIVSTLNKYSNNFMAEQILKTLAAELKDAPGTWKKGSEVLADFMEELGQPRDAFVFGNGSGLNDINRITPEQITHVLHSMYKRFEVRPEFVASLAVAGASGTINGRFENSPAVSRLRAKTGSLTGVSALSGYVVTQDDQVLAFSVMMNDYRGRARTMWRIQDQIGIALARLRNQDAVAQQGTRK